MCSPMRCYRSFYMSLESEQTRTENSDCLDLYDWLDSIPLSRPKRNISRDFSDCVLAAELVHHYKPTSISLHNYPSTSSFKQKVLNWETFNMKVMRKLNMRVTRSDIDNCANVCQQAPTSVIFYRLFQEPSNGSYSSSSESCANQVLHQQLHQVINL